MRKKGTPTLYQPGIYKITNIVNGQFYIGSGAGRSGIGARLNFHRYNLRKAQHPNYKLQNSWNKYGESNFRFEVIEFCRKSQSLNREQYYIDTLNPEFNILRFVTSRLGSKHTPETLLKLKGRIPWNKGNKKSKIQEDPILKAKRLDKSKKLANKKRSKAMKGRKKNPLIVEKIAQKRRIPIIAINLNTKQKTYFAGVRRAAEFLNLDVSMISKVCKGKHSYYKEWTFKYVTN